MFLEVVNKFFSEEKKLREGYSVSPEDSALVAENRKKKNFKLKKLVYWGCGQCGNLKRNCLKGRADSASSSK